MHAPAGASSVHPVVRVTGNFTSESPLHPAATSALLAAFDQGWADPKKLSQSSAKAAILLNQSLENIASRLGIRPDSIEILGEPALGHFLGVAGLTSETSTLAYSAIDKGKIRAVVRAHRGPTVELPVNHQGAIEGISTLSPQSVLSFQLANQETGIIQEIAELAPHEILIAVDATASGSRTPLPSRWNTALFDATSWNGPAGIAILAINNAPSFTYPLPHIAPIKSPGTYSLPLLIAASVALENFQSEGAGLRTYAMAKLLQVPGLEVVAPKSNALPHIFSCVISGVAGEYLVRELGQRGVDIDSGSACSPEDLQPSHVLAAMGYATEGHLRLTLHTETSEKEIDYLVESMTDVVAQLRR